MQSICASRTGFTPKANTGMRYKNTTFWHLNIWSIKGCQQPSTKDFYLIQMAIYRSLDVQSLFAVNGFSNQQHLYLLKVAQLTVKQHCSGSSLSSHKTTTTTYRYQECTITPWLKGLYISTPIPDFALTKIQFRAYTACTQFGSTSNV